MDRCHILTETKAKRKRAGKRDKEERLREKELEKR